MGHNSIETNVRYGPASSTAHPAGEPGIRTPDSLEVGLLVNAQVCQRSGQVKSPPELIRDQLVGEDVLRQKRRAERQERLNSYQRRRPGVR